MDDRRRQSRREFIKKGTVGIAGAALLTSCSDPAVRRSTPERGKKPVIRTLGKTGIRLPVVSMGSAYAINLVQAALDEGIVYIHTSSGYYERNHERLLGDVFRDRPRESFVIGTSPDLPYEYVKGQSRSANLGLSVDPEVILTSIDGSLERLGLEYVDIYYLGSLGIREEVLFEPYMRAYEKLKRDGKIRFAGVVTHTNEPEVIRAAAESGFWDIVLTSYNFKQSHREEIRAAIGEAAGAGLGVVAMKTQAGVYRDWTRTRKYDMRAALKWVLQDENVHTTIPAFANFDEMREDLSIMEDLTLTPAEIRDLGVDEVASLPGLYCQQCGRCVEQCPAGVDIPLLMRGYMYAFGHGKPRKTRDELRQMTPVGIACKDCRRCEVHCSLGFDVRSRALEVARILSTEGISSA